MNTGSKIIIGRRSARRMLATDNVLNQFIGESVDWRNQISRKIATASGTKLPMASNKSLNVERDDPCKYAPGTQNSQLNAIVNPAKTTTSRNGVVVSRVMGIVSRIFV